MTACIARGCLCLILTVCLQAKLGWSGAALQAGANDLGLSRAAAGVVPNGAAGLVEVTASLAPMTVGAPLLLIIGSPSLQGTPELFIAACYIRLSKACMALQYFVNNCNQRLVDHLEDRADELGSMRTPQRVRLALQARLEMLIPVMGEPSKSLAS